MAEKEKKKAGFFQWFFMLFLIPLLFAVVLSVAVMSFMGINVTQLGQDVVKSVTGSEESADDAGASGEELEAKEEEIVELQQRLDEREQELRSVEEELEELTLESETEENNEEEESSGNAGSAQKIYEEMKPATAAAVLGQQETEVIVQHLYSLQPEEQAAILEEMDEELAASVVSGIEGLDLEQ
jgi:flagellar motility protein MotE (MotC chaperone)